MSRSELALFVGTLATMVLLSWINLANIRVQMEIASVERMCRE